MRLTLLELKGDNEESVKIAHWSTGTPTLVYKDIRSKGINSNFTNVRK